AMRTRKHGRLSAVVALMLIPDKGRSQQSGQSGWSQQGGQSGAHRLYARAKENPAIPAAPEIEPTSPLGQDHRPCTVSSKVKPEVGLSVNLSQPRLAPSRRPIPERIDTTTILLPVSAVMPKPPTR